jgi:hypothetical protein
MAKKVERITIKCKWCQKEIKVLPRDIEVRNRGFCSKSCRSRYTVNNQWATKKCKKCGKRFKAKLNQLYCSYGCKPYRYEIYYGRKNKAALEFFEEHQQCYIKEAKAIIQGTKQKINKCIQLKEQLEPREIEGTFDEI